MITLKIDDALEEVRLNDKVSVWLNLTDTHFINKLFDAFNQMDKARDEYRGRIEELENKELFDFARNLDLHMREIINGVFGVDVCTPLFGETSVCAIANGLPLWANLMLALIDEIDSTIAREKKITNPRILKYTEKYSKKK